MVAFCNFAVSEIGTLLAFGFFVSGTREVKGAFLFLWCRKMGPLGVHPPWGAYRRRVASDAKQAAHQSHTKKCGPCHSKPGVWSTR
jgi:hypothetical protein